MKLFLYLNICFRDHIRRDNHELLEGEAATSVGTTVQDVLEGDGEDIGLLGTGKVGDVSVERDTLLSSTSLGNGQADTEDGVGTKVLLVGRAVELVQELVNLGLVFDVEVLLDDGRSDLLVDVGDGLGDTYSMKSVSSVMFLKPEIFVTHPFRATWPCHRHGAREPRAGLE